MENLTPNSSSTGVFHTFRRWPMYRQLRYILDYRKISLVVIFSLVSFGRYIQHNSIHFESNSQEISSISVVKSYATQNIGITSNPELIQRMAERKKVLSERKRLAESVCKNITKDNPLHKPRDETLQFDILWEPHYQVSDNLIIRWHDSNCRVSICSPHVLTIFFPHEIECW